MSIPGGVPITALPSATVPLSGTEDVAIVQGGVTKKTAASNIGAIFGDATGASIRTSTTANGYDISSTLAAIGFGGTWYANNIFSSSFATTHSEGRFTGVNIRVATGSGVNGPGTADYAGADIIYKLDYLTSAVAGEVNGRYVIVRQGTSGDAGGLLIDVQKVGSVGGQTPIETGTAIISSAGAVLNQTHTVTGFCFNGSTPSGFWAEAWVGGCDVAFASSTFDQSSGLNVPVWTDFIRQYVTRGGSVNFRVNSAGDLSGKSVSVTGQLISTVAFGTAPLIVTSGTVVANLNASFLLGSNWASPGAIGATVPNTGVFSQAQVSGTTAADYICSVSTAGVDQKNSDHVASTTSVLDRLVSDNFGSATVYDQQDRSGITPAARTFTATSFVFNGGPIIGSAAVRSGSFIVSTLPAATVGDRVFCTDLSVVAAGNFGTVAAGSGANKGPLYYDAAWRIG